MLLWIQDSDPELGHSPSLSLAGKYVMSPELHLAAVQLNSSTVSPDLVIIFLKILDELNDQIILRVFEFISDPEPDQ